MKSDFKIVMVLARLVKRVKQAPPRPVWPGALIR